MIRSDIWAFPWNNTKLIICAIVEKMRAKLFLSRKIFWCGMAKKLRFRLNATN